MFTYIKLWLFCPHFFSYEFPQKRYIHDKTTIVDLQSLVHHIITKLAIIKLNAQIFNNCIWILLFN